MSTHTEAEVRATLGTDRPRRWPWALGAVGAIGIAGGIWLGTRPAVRGMYTYETVPVERGDLEIKVTAVGSLEPSNAVSIGSELSGIVLRVLVDENDTVEEGQLLAELDTDLLRAQARQSRASVDAAEATLEQALATVQGTSTELARAQQLFQHKSTSEAALEQAKTSHSQAVAGVSLAEAQLQQARASYAAARTNLEKTRIVSPIDGVVLERAVEEGQAVVSSLQATTLFRVAEDLRAMTVDVEVDEADVGRIEAGQAADFTVAAYPDRVFDAQVEKVNLAPNVSGGVVTYVATLSLENPELELLPGMTATASITAETFDQVLLVPNEALRFTPDKSTLPPPEPVGGRRMARLWVLSGEEPQPVEVTPIATDGRRTLVEGPVHEGDQIVLSAQRARRNADRG